MFLQQEESRMEPSLYSNDPSTLGASESMSAGFFIALGFLAILSYVVSAIFMGMMFQKAGIPAWKAWVPVYNSWTFLEMGGQKGWISLLLLLGWIPLLGLIPVIVAAVYLCIAAYRIGLNFGKEGWFVVLYIFFTLVWLIWLAVDKTAVWNGGTTAANTDDQTPPSAPAQPTAM
jgi:hypothetical protein